MIKNLIMGALAFLSTLAIGVSTSKKIGVFETGTLMAASSEDVIEYDHSEVLKYFQNEYGEKNVYDLKLTYDNSFYIQNFKQSDLNEMYNLEYDLDEDSEKAPIQKKCTLVACLGLVNYYSNTLGEFESDSNTDEIYLKIVNACLKEGCAKRTVGVDTGDVDDCVSTSFKRFGSKRRGDSNGFYLLDNINDAIRWKSAVIFDLTNHSTVVRGKVKYELTYNKKYTEGILWWKKTKYKKVTETFEFIHINEGWGYRNGALVRSDKIYNIFSEQQVTWAKK